ncbi:hypothetical protein GCM10018965_069610 [Nonomuraea roseola]
MKRSESGGAALRWMTVPRPQEAAAPTHSRKAPTGPPAPKSKATMASPAKATASPTILRVPGRSPSTTAAKTTTNSAWVCSTSEERPGGMPARMPTRSKPNCPTPTAAATPTIHRHATPGRPTNSSAGKAARAKRSAA